MWPAKNCSSSDSISENKPIVATDTVTAAR